MRFCRSNWRQNQSVSGIAINMFVLGVTSFFSRILKEGKSYQQLTTYSTIKIPILSDIPLIGDALFNQDIFTYLLYILVIVMTVFYAKTAKGLAFQAVGEQPRLRMPPVFPYININTLRCW